MKNPTEFCFSLLLSLFLLASFTPNLIAKSGFDISLGTGLFFPSQKEVKDFYGSPMVNMSAELAYRLGRNLSFCIGGQVLSRKTTAKELIGSFPGSDYSVELSLRSFYLGGRYHFLWGKKLTPYAGFLLAQAAIRERWPEVDYDFKHKRFGLTALAGCRFYVGSTLFLLLECQLSTLKSGAGDLLVEDVNLGGLSLRMGLGLTL
jgi:opacity protein-like surface antigen